MALDSCIVVLLLEYSKALHSVLRLENLKFKIEVEKN